MCGGTLLNHSFSLFPFSLASLGQHCLRHLSQLHLPDFPAARYWDGAGNAFLAKDKHILRSLMTAKGLARPATELLVGGTVVARSNLDKRTYHLTVFLVGDANDGSELNGGVGGQALFNFEGIDVLAA